MKNLNYGKIVCGLSGFLISVGLGMAIAHYEVFPFSVAKFAMNSLAQVFRERQMLLGVRPAEHLFPARYSGAGVTRVKIDQVSPGLTLLSGFLDGNPSLQLIRADGSVVKRWPALFSTVFRDTTHVQPSSDVPATDWNVQIHGALALPDGSVVFNFSYKGMVKIPRSSF